MTFFHSDFKIDDSEDVDILDSLMEVYPPPWIQVMSTEEIVGISPGHIVKCCQTFSQVGGWKGTFTQPLFTTNPFFSSSHKK